MHVWFMGQMEIILYLYFQFHYFQFSYLITLFFLTFKFDTELVNFSISYFLI